MQHAALKLHARGHGDAWRAFIPALPLTCSIPTIPNEIPAAGLRTVVFVGAMEHHSNLLVWRECTEVVLVPHLPCGRLDQLALSALLLAHATVARRIGSFSAASNITGILLFTLTSGICLFTCPNLLPDYNQHPYMFSQGFVKTSMTSPHSCTAMARWRSGILLQQLRTWISICRRLCARRIQRCTRRMLCFLGTLIITF